MYRHFFTDAISESIATGGGFGMSSILQQQLNNQVTHLSEKQTEEFDLEVSK